MGYFLMIQHCTYQQSIPGQIELNCPQAAAQLPQGPDLFDLALHYSWRIVLGIVVLLLLLNAFFIVRQQSTAIVERFGRFARIAGPGIHWRIPLVEHVVKTLWLRIQQLDIEADTKTKDNVFVVANISVQSRVLANRVTDAYYKLADEAKQLQAFVLDTVRATIPGMTLDEVFEHKDRIATAVKAALTEKMGEYGYEITDVLVPEIIPDAGVRNAMNAIQEQTRLQAAAAAKGEANKILIVKQAEAEAESKRLQGEGIAKQRQAIVDGLKNSLANMTEATGIDAGEALRMVVLTQYFDTLKEIGVSSNSKVVFMPNSPGAMKDIHDQVLTAMLAADAGRT